MLLHLVQLGQRVTPLELRQRVTPLELRGVLVAVGRGPTADTKEKTNPRMLGFQDFVCAWACVFCVQHSC